MTILRDPERKKTRPPIDALYIDPAFGDKDPNTPQGTPNSKGFFASLGTLFGDFFVRFFGNTAGYQDANDLLARQRAQDAQYGDPTFTFYDPEKVQKQPRRGLDVADATGPFNTVAASQATTDRSPAPTATATPIVTRRS